jgi:SAM-dependent methyltransferase
MSTNYTKEYYQNILFSKYNFTLERRKIFSFYLNIIRKRKHDISKILDIGCAYGYFLKIFEDSGIPQIYGVDISNDALKEANNLCKKAHILKANLSKERSSFPNDFFDVITAIDLIEHVEDIQVFLKEVYRILDRRGLVFFITPNPRSLRRRLYLRFKGTGEDPTHINLKTAGGWIKEFKNAGFKHVELKGCIIHGFPPLTDLRDKLGKFQLIKPILVNFEAGERFYFFLTKS